MRFRQYRSPFRWGEKLTKPLLLIILQKIEHEAVKYPSVLGLYEKNMRKNGTNCQV
jgi:hypothetical protein